MQRICEYITGTVIRYRLARLFGHCLLRGGGWYKHTGLEGLGIFSIGAGVKNIARVVSENCKNLVSQFVPPHPPISANSEPKGAKFGYFYANYMCSFLRGRKYIHANS